MASRTRSLDGCWTCRLRRKKCDEVRPVCNGCAALEIDCLFSDEKPEWMDNGEKQKQRVEWLKRDVKKKAGIRRERRFLQTLENDMEGLDVSQMTADENLDYPMMMDNSSGAIQPRRETPMSASSSSVYDSGFHSEGHVAPMGLALASTSLQSPSNSLNGSVAVGHHSPVFLNNVPILVWPQLQEQDMNFLMMYLDFVFPFLFPFYRPPIMHAGRGWLLSLLTRNKSLLHGALGVASHFYSVITEHLGTVVHQSCKDHSWAAMQKQQELALQELQREMQEIVIRGVRGYPAESSRVLASIVQILTFEVAIANTGNWMIHLDAAIEVFNAIMENHTESEPDNEECTCFGELLSQLGPSPSHHTSHNHPWNSDQAAFRFFTAYLLFFDTLASTSLEQPPRLQKWHHHLLTPQPTAQQNGTYPTPHIDLADFLGLNNWVIIAIGQVSSLSAWKKSQKSAGSLSVNQLVSRAAQIEQTLRENMATIDTTFLHKPPCPEGSSPHLSPLEQYTQHTVLLPSIMADAISGLTYVWAQSTLTYLSVVVSGWQPSNPEIRDSVRLTIAMIKALPTSTCVRTCVWPFTITGCMAGREEEQVFRDAIAGMGPMSVFGTMREALGVMEGVWGMRGVIEGDVEGWDLGVCLGGRGERRVLLV